MEHIQDIISNKKARFNYEIIETFEAGIVLKGTEVKSVRMKKISIQEAYCKIRNNEIFITGMTISHYHQGNIHNHLPERDRKLLLHKKEIKRLTGKVQEKGFTLVPLKVYIKNGKVKVLLGLGKGKAKYDKRDTIKKRDADRDMQREIKKYQR